MVYSAKPQRARGSIVANTNNAPQGMIPADVTPPPVGGNMLYEDGIIMLYEDGVIMDYEA